MAKLDRTRPFGITIGAIDIPELEGAHFFQDGKYFRSDDTEIVIGSAETSVDLGAVSPSISEKSKVSKEKSTKAVDDLNLL